MTAPADTLTISDRALLQTLRACGEADADDARFWDCFSPGWRGLLRAGWVSSATVAPEYARDCLRREHEAQARPDLARIHSSWWVRALKDESPAVQRTVTAHAPPALRGALMAGLNLAEADLVADRPGVAEAVRCALSLWTERMVGDLGERDDDPPVIIVLTRLDVPEFTRLVHAAGLVKWTLAWETPEVVSPRDRERLLHFRASFAEPSPRLKQLAKHDVATYGRTDRPGKQSLGLMTIARLLEVVEPYRVRWALQHLPYPVARFTRTLMNPKPRRSSSLAPWEELVLKAASERLRDEALHEGNPEEVA